MLLSCYSSTRWLVYRQVDRKGPIPLAAGAVVACSQHSESSKADLHGWQMGRRSAAVHHLTGEDASGVLAGYVARAPTNSMR
jgi:hypothetical protein